MSANSMTPTGILSALRLNQDRHKWLQLLYDNLPELYTCDVSLSSLGSSSCCLIEKSTTWEQYVQNLTNAPGNLFEEPSCAQVVKKPIEVFVHKNLNYLSYVTDSDQNDGVPLRVQLALSDVNFQSSLREQLASRDSSSSEVLLRVSVLSGLIVHVPQDLVCLVTTKYSNLDANFPPTSFTLDGTSLGPVYLSFFLENPLLQKNVNDLTEAGVTGKTSRSGSIVFEFHFFNALTSNGSLTESSTNEETTFFRKNVANMKYVTDKEIISTSLPTIHTTTTTTTTNHEGQTRSRIEISGAFSFTLHHSQYNQLERFAVIVCPKLKYLLCDKRFYTTGSGLFSDSEGGQLRATNWFPIVSCLPPPPPPPNDGTTASSFTIAILGECVNNGVLVCFVRQFSSWSESVKPGFNGFFQQVVGSKLYKQIATYCRQLNRINELMSDVEQAAGQLVKRYRSLGGTKNGALVHLRFKKALLYACSFEQYCLLQSDLALAEGISDESITLIGNSKDLIDAEEMADYVCLHYDADVEKEIVKKTLNLSQVKRDYDRKSFMLLLSSHASLRSELEEYLCCAKKRNRAEGIQNSKRFKATASWKNV